MDFSQVTNEAYREIFQSMSEGIVMVDESGKITIANPVAEQLFGYGKDALAGMSLEDQLPERYRKGTSILGELSIQIHTLLSIITWKPDLCQVTLNGLLRPFRHGCKSEILRCNRHGYRFKIPA